MARHGPFVVVSVADGVLLGSVVSVTVCLIGVIVRVAVGVRLGFTVAVAVVLGVEVGVDVGNQGEGSVAVDKIVGSGVRVSNTSGG